MLGRSLWQVGDSTIVSRIAIHITRYERLMAVPFLIMGRVTYLHHYVSGVSLRAH